MNAYSDGEGGIDSLSHQGNAAQGKRADAFNIYSRKPNLPESVGQT